NLNPPLIPPLYIYPYGKGGKASLAKAGGFRISIFNPPGRDAYCANSLSSLKELISSSVRIREYFPGFSRLSLYVSFVASSFISFLLSFRVKRAGETILE